MTNAEMRPNRFAKWAEARRTLAWCRSCWERGYNVLVCTATRATRLSPKHAEYLKATKSGLYIRSGSKWVCADYCAFRAER